MMRTPWYIILISLVMVSCNNPDTAKNAEQMNENNNQSISGKSFSSEEALMKEIEMISKRDFRKAKWGMDRATVKLTETDDPVGEDDSSIIYSRKIAGMSALLGYVFEEDKLVKARYMFQQKHENLNEYITDHNNLKKALEKKYGKAKKERAIWSNDLYTRIPEQWGIALGLGYLTYLSYWNSKNTEITLTLKGENNKIDFWLEYNRKAPAKLENKTGALPQTDGR